MYNMKVNTIFTIISTAFLLAYKIFYLLLRSHKPTALIRTQANYLKAKQTNYNDWKIKDTI